MISPDLLPANLAKRITVDERGCWRVLTWRSGKQVLDGYTAIGYAGGTEASHRVSYLTLVGQIPEGYQIDHLCHQPNCCNPAHLEAVTAQVNDSRRRPYGEKVRRT